MADLFGLDKTDKAIEVLHQLEPEDGYFLAFSGGKDSIVLYEIAKLAKVKFDAHYHCGAVDPPELRRFISAKYPDVIWDRPKKTMWELIPSEHIPPTRIVRYCCEELKESRGLGRVVLTGIRADESINRTRKWKSISMCSKAGKMMVHPLLWWTEEDIWTFIKSRGMEYCKLYDEGFKRLGCIGCPMAGPDRQRQEFVRWPKYRAAYIRAFDRMLEERKKRGMSPFWGGSTGEEVMAWWLQEPQKENDEDQPLFS